MKLSPTHVTQALNQIRAEPVAMASDKDGAQKMEVARLVRLAHWRDEYHSSLVPQLPQQTDTVVMLSKAA
ncbi:hypothetical protein C5L14_01445 [Labrys okinawensis]|uniref:Uncharacterized protein n=1 Tax=Labrys okinawensis TaxID=346911 RepID=A0A2S9QIV3_9HYPH|nr:hypothetical protein [Labrys okinawensis]PRH89287.1 hypothetical protein C5L14_01445 [Labrys okinawensis]